MKINWFASVFILPTLLICISVHAIRILDEPKAITVQHRPSLGCGETRHLPSEESNLNSSQLTAIERNLTAGEYPWIARISADPRGLQHHCAAVIVGPRHLLTSASCLNPCQRRPKLWVFVGDHSFYNIDGETRYEISEIIIHEDYKPFPPTMANAVRHNIGIVKTKRQMRFRLTADGYGSVNRICLPESDVTAGENLTIAGWSFPGRIDPSKLTDLPRSREVLVRRKCPGFSQSVRMGLGSFCTAAEEFGHCTGDPGGPVIRRRGDTYELVGIVSYGRQTSRKNCTKKLPLVSTRVFYYQDWISRHMTRRNRSNQKKRKMNTKKSLLRPQKTIHMISSSASEATHKL